MKLEMGVQPAGSRPLYGLGLRRRPGRGIIAVEYGLLLALAAILGGFVIREFGAGVGAIFAVAAGAL